MSIKDNTRWRSNGIVADHRPGRFSHHMGKPGIGVTPRVSGVPAHIKRYIETGEGARPAAEFVEPDGFAVVKAKDNRPRCITDGCNNLLASGGEARFCATCIRSRNAERMKSYRKRIDRERKPQCI